MKRPVSQAALDMRLLANYFLTMHPGDICTYDDMVFVLGRDVHRTQSYIIQRAKSIAEREGHRVFGSIRGIGIKYLHDNEIPAIGEVMRRSLHRKAKKTLHKLGVIQMDKLQEQEMYKALCYASIAGAVLAMTHMRTLRQVEAVIATQETPVRLDIPTLKKLL